MTFSDFVTLTIPLIAYSVRIATYLVAVMH
jgi:hypothetical protein